MLQTFLNRLARHPILSNEHVFHRFLDGEVSWVRLYDIHPLGCFSSSLIDRGSQLAAAVAASEEYPQSTFTQSH